MYIIYYADKNGRNGSMPSNKRQLVEDLKWLERNGDRIVKVVCTH